MDPNLNGGHTHTQEDLALAKKTLKEELTKDEVVCTTATTYSDLVQSGADSGYVTYIDQDGKLVTAPLNNLSHHTNDMSVAVTKSITTVYSTMNDTIVITTPLNAERFVNIATEKNLQTVSASAVFHTSKHMDNDEIRRLLASSQLIIFPKMSAVIIQDVLLDSKDHELLDKINEGAGFDVTHGGNHTHQYRLNLTVKDLHGPGNTNTVSVVIDNKGGSTGTIPLFGVNPGLAKKIVEDFAKHGKVGDRQFAPREALLLICDLTNRVLQLFCPDTKFFIGTPAGKSVDPSQTMEEICTNTPWNNQNQVPNGRYGGDDGGRVLQKTCYQNFQHIATGFFFDNCETNGSAILALPDKCDAIGCTLMLHLAAILANLLSQQGQDAPTKDRMHKVMSAFLPKSKLDRSTMVDQENELADILTKMSAPFSAGKFHGGEAKDSVEVATHDLESLMSKLKGLSITNERPELRMLVNILSNEVFKNEVPVKFPCTLHWLAVRFAELVLEKNDLELSTCPDAEMAVMAESAGQSPHQGLTIPSLARSVSAGYVDVTAPRVGPPAKMSRTDSATTTAPRGGPPPLSRTVSAATTAPRGGPPPMLSRTFTGR